MLCPTRDLARQLQEELNEVAYPLGLSTMVFHGGVLHDPQIRALWNSIDVLVGTPVRFIDHINNGNIDLLEANTKRCYGRVLTDQEGGKYEHERGIERAKNKVEIHMIL